jgi:hypothetical protein
MIKMMQREANMNKTKLKKLSIDIRKYEEIRREYFKKKEEFTYTTKLKDLRFNSKYNDQEHDGLIKPHGFGFSCFRLNRSNKEIDPEKQIKEDDKNSITSYLYKPLTLTTTRRNILVLLIMIIFVVSLYRNININK